MVVCSLSSPTAGLASLCVWLAFMLMVVVAAADDCRYDIGGRPASELPAGMLDRLFGPELDALHPYGVDPVFLPSSKLYDSDLKDKVSYYYDTRNGSGEVSATGAPYAHFPRTLPGYADGFPLLLPDSVSVGRMAEMVTFLKVGSYLMASSSTWATAVCPPHMPNQPWNPASDHDPS